MEVSEDGFARGELSEVGGDSERVGPWELGPRPARSATRRSGTVLGDKLAPGGVGQRTFLRATMLRSLGSHLRKELGNC